MRVTVLIFPEIDDRYGTYSSLGAPLEKWVSVLFKASVAKVLYFQVRVSRLRIPGIVTFSFAFVRFL